MTTKRYVPSKKHVLKYCSAWKKENFSDTINVRGTVGAGDFMYLLNVAYFRSFLLQKRITINYNWFHSEDYLYHFEDPETIIERLNYAHNFFLKDSTDVVINHVFNSEDTKLYHDFYNGYLRGGKVREFYDIYPRYNEWAFRDIGAKTVPGKIVMWTQVSNSAPPRDWKRPFDKEEWDYVKTLIELQGYNVVQIDYRTPISEVFYHISTCQCTVSYEGMWHYVAKNFHKPMIVLTADGITRWHTPDALIYEVDKNHRHEFHYFHDFDRRLKRATDFSKNKLVKLNRIMSIEEI